MNIKITGTGSCIPKNTKLNSGFSENSFYDSNGVHIESSNSEIIENSNFCRMCGKFPLT